MAFNEPVLTEVRHVQRHYIETFYTKFHQNRFVNAGWRVEILPRPAVMCDFPEPNFTKSIVIHQSFVKNLYRELCENTTDSLVTDTR